MDYIAELAAIAKEHGGIIETKIAAQHGISKAMLYKLCKEDRIHRIVKGQYILPDDVEDELLSISKRSTQIIFSHETALFLHGISDRTPFEHTITAPSGCIPSAAIKAECKVYYIKPELFDLGKTELKTPAGNLVPCYDLERTVCDVIRSRNKLGTETFLAALEGIEIEGIFTHFAVADEFSEDSDRYTAEQYRIFYETCEKIEQEIQEKYNGRIRAAYGCSLGGSFVAFRFSEKRFT